MEVSVLTRMHIWVTFGFGEQTMFCRYLSDYTVQNEMTQAEF